jgi:PAS domain S-box-containing protein
MSTPRRLKDWMTAHRATLRRYALALVFIAAAIFLRTLLNPFMGQQSVVVFLAAILLSAWFGGAGPGIASTFLLHVVHAYWFLDPHGFWPDNLASVVSTIAYYLVGATVGVLSEKRRQAQRRERDQRQEAVSQREHLRTTLSCMAEGVVVTNVHGEITLMNPVAEAMTGWKLADARGKKYEEVVAIQSEIDDGFAERPIDLVLGEGQVVHQRTPVTLASRTGRSTPITYSAAPVRGADGQSTGVVLIFKDESERQRIELALRNADRRKDEFLATLAHELRNPLAPIATGLELLKASADDPQSHEEVRQMMQRQTEHMVRLIDDLMDVSRITRGKLTLRKSEVDLNEIVRGAVQSAQPLIAAAKHELAVNLPDRPLPLLADASRLTQVVTNLLNNAAKYTPTGGRIEITVEQDVREATITVADTGIGIPSDKIGDVFDMFTQINDSGEHGHTGLGIGLTLVKRLVEMHGGRVEVESRGHNLGTVFRVHLPALAEAPASVDVGVQNGQLGSRPASRRILVVDDNLDALASLSRLVSLMGNEVRRAHDGQEALEVARAFHPDIVLMDLGMPRLNGFDAARQMREEPWARNVSLVATTGWGQEEDRRRSAAAGFDRHLVKPISVDALRDVLQAPIASHAD